MRKLLVFAFLILVAVAIETEFKSPLIDCFKKPELGADVPYVPVDNWTIPEQMRKLGMGLPMCMLVFAMRARTTPNELFTVGYHAGTGSCRMLKISAMSGLRTNPLSHSGYDYYELKNAECLSAWNGVAIQRYPVDAYCAPDEWRCNNGQCIKAKYYQDKKYLDCEDCSDENENLWDENCLKKSSTASETSSPLKHIENLGNSNCTADQRQCKNGACIPAKYYQDKKYLDCSDCSHENESIWDSKCPNKSSTTFETRATTSRPIKNFANSYCTAEQWRCNNGQCIPKAYRHDRQYLDCDDCSDEDESIWDMNCPTKSPMTSKSQTIWSPRNNFYGTTCTADQWQCDNGQCIQRYFHQDGRFLHCADCSDEDESVWDSSCPTKSPTTSKSQTIWNPKSKSYGTTCTADQWQCDNGQCIQRYFHQDGKFLDCADCSDEDKSVWDSTCPSKSPTTSKSHTIWNPSSSFYGTKCTADQWQCADGDCIPKEFHRDGIIPDCRDCSDEAREIWPSTCPGMQQMSKTKPKSNPFGSVCSVDEWQCMNGWQCIKKQYYQDGYLDCNDCSDEHLNIWDGHCPTPFPTRSASNLPPRVTLSETFSDCLARLLTGPFACLCVCLVLLALVLAFLARKISSNGAARVGLQKSD